MNEYTNWWEKCIYSIKKKKNNIQYYTVHLLESRRSFRWTVRLSSATNGASTFLLRFFVDSAHLFGFSLTNLFHATLWHEIIGLSFKYHTRSTSAWIFHEFNARFLEAHCYISHRQNILNPDIHEVVYYLLYFSSHLCNAYGRTTCNLSLAPGPYENWRGYINGTTLTSSYWAHPGYSTTAILGSSPSTNFDYKTSLFGRSGCFIDKIGLKIPLISLYSCCE